MKARKHSSSLLSSILDSITEKEQLATDRRMKLAVRIYEAMRAKGWNQKQFAESLGKKTPEICRWLSGTHTFTSDTLWAIGDVLDIDLLPVENKSETQQKEYFFIVHTQKVDIGHKNPAIDKSIEPRVLSCFNYSAKPRTSSPKICYG